MIDINEIVCFIESCSLLSNESIVSIFRGDHDIFGPPDKQDCKAEKNLSKLWYFIGAMNAFIACAGERLS